MSSSKHISNIRKTCHYHIRDFACIRRYLPKTVAITLANALVSSHIDYCNSLLRGCTKREIQRLQQVQNTLCRIVNRVSRFSSVKPYLKDLHWLPVAQRIDFKWCLLIYKYINTGNPSYFSSSITPYTCSYQTRRSETGKNYLNTVSFDHSIYKSKRWFDSCFSTAAPRLWNSLPIHIRTASSTPCFRRGLKAYLFGSVFPT